MSVAGASAKLEAAWRNLRYRWDATAEDWRDQVREQFAADHLDELDATLRRVLREMTQLGDILQKARRECE